MLKWNAGKNGPNMKSKFRERRTANPKSNDNGGGGCVNKTQPALEINMGMHYVYLKGNIYMKVDYLTDAIV